MTVISTQFVCGVYLLNGVKPSRRNLSLKFWRILLVLMVLKISIVDITGAVVPTTASGL